MKWIYDDDEEERRRYVGMNDCSRMRMPSRGQLAGGTTQQSASGSFLLDRCQQVSKFKDVLSFRYKIYLERVRETRVMPPLRVLCNLSAA